MRTLKHSTPLFLLALVALSQGCQVYNAGAGFISQRYVNAVAYFNTYYNAQRSFDDAEKEVLASQQSQQGQASVPAQGSSVPQSARAKFTTAIEKASKLLSYYPTSKWVDDALLLIGKSYFYLEDDLKAERKFLELFAKYPESSLRFETELWYGRTLLRQKRYDEGVQALDKLYAKAVDDNDKEIAGLASSAVGNYLYEKKEYERAAKYYQQSVAISKDDRLNAAAQLQAAYCYRELGDMQKAAEAFSHVADFNPDYALGFTAELENIKILTRTQKYEEALVQLFLFLDDPKNAENFGKVQLEIANIYLAQNRYADAITKYTFVDTTFVRTEQSATAYYCLGRLYETRNVDYAKARLNYDRARSEFPTAALTADAAKKADALQKYFSLQSDLSKYDSLIVAVGERKARRDSLLAVVDTVRRVEDSTSRNSNTRVAHEGQSKNRSERDSLARLDSIRSANERAVLVTERQIVDSLQQLSIKTKFELAGLFYLEINRPDSAMFWFRKVIAEGGNLEIVPRSLFTTAEIYRSVEGTDKRILDSLYQLIIARFPESPYAQESRRALGIALLPVKSDPGEELFLKAERYTEGANSDSALPFLYRLVKENSASSFSAKALYTLGWLYENKLEKKDSASAVYRRLIAGYPDSKFTLLIRPKIQEEDSARREAERLEKEELEAKKKEAEQQKKDEKPSEEDKSKVRKDKP